MAARINDNPNINCVKILLVSQNYEGYLKLDGIKKNVKTLEGVYARLQKRKGFNFRNRYIIDDFFKRSNTFEDLREDILSGEYDIIHFSLHSDEGTIFFSDSEQITHPRLGSLFSIETDIKAVILNICKSDDIVPKICRNVQFVLGWSHEVIIDDAIRVSEIFYSSLFKGRSIEESFRSVEADKTIKPVICKNPKQENNKVKRIFKLLFTLISIGLVLVFLIVAVNKILDPGHADKIIADSDSLQITFPPSGSPVEWNETLKVDAKLIAGRMPWVFILPPGGTEWWPQNKGTIQDDHWEFRVSFGNQIDSGRFSVLALIVQDKIAEDMQEWYDSQGTGIKSDPLSEEVIRKFFWYEADTAHYYRIQQ